MQGPFNGTVGGAVGAIGSGGSEAGLSSFEAGLSLPRATAATILPSGRAVCPSPRAHPNQTRLTAEILVNGTAQGPLVALELGRPASVDQILPVLLVGASGGPVTVLGHGFSPSTVSECLFTSAYGELRTPATLLSPSRALCAAPARQDTTRSGERVAVSLLGEAGVADGEARLIRRATPLILSISPSVAVSAPGQAVVLAGSHLAPSRGVKP